jgi:hypothetical protein
MRDVGLRTLDRHRDADQRHPAVVVPPVNQKYLSSVAQTIRKLVPALPTLRLDDSKCVALQSLQLRLCLRQLRFGHHLWRS